MIAVPIGFQKHDIFISKYYKKLYYRMTFFFAQSANCSNMNVSRRFDREKKMFDENRRFSQCEIIRRPL